MRYKKTLLFSFIIFTLALGLFIVNPVKAALADKTYTLNKEVLYNSNNPPYNSFNMENDIKTFTERYNASYSFENDDIESNPDHFITSEPDTAQVGVIANLDGHNKVVRMNQTTGSTYGLTQNFESAQNYGTIEFWFQSSNVDASHVNYFWLMNGGGSNYAIYAYAQSDKFRYYDGAHKDIPNVPIPLDNVWFRIRIDFELTAGGYLGMAQYRCIFTINGVSSGALGLASNEASVDNMFWRGSSSHLNYGQFLDALGYSWESNYTIGMNLIPDTDILNVNRISRYEFTFEDVNDIYEIGESNPESWSSTGSSLIYYNYDDVLNNRVVRMSSIGVLTPEFEKDNLAITGSNFINITYSMNITQYDNNVGWIGLDIDSSDSTEVLDLRVYKSGGIISFNYYWASYNLLYSGMNLNDLYTFNILINYEMDVAIIELRENGVVIGNYIIPFIQLGKSGLKKLNFYAAGIAGNNIIVDIDYVGIYNNGMSSIEADSSYGFLELDFGFRWYMKYHNLLNITASGLIQIYNAVRNWSSYNVGDPTYEVDSFSQHYNTTRTINVYDIGQWGEFSFTWESTVVLYFKDNISFSFINIEGVSLTEGINKHWLEQSHSGIISNESYFYVDDSNRLQFSLNCDDTNLEYIQAEFNILDISSKDYAIEFRSNIDNIAYGYFRVNFTDVSNLIPIPIYDTTSRFLLSQNQTINSLIILITDENIDSVLGLTEGYVSNIKLLFVAGVGVSITTSNLLTIIIPLIIIFIPTFLLSSRVGKSMIVPLMMLMSLICVATEIIPIWLFFVIIFPSSLFLFLKRKELI